MNCKFLKDGLQVGEGNLTAVHKTVSENYTKLLLRDFQVKVMRLFSVTSKHYC